MKYIDLHVHSNVSDGTFTPTELVACAVSQNLDAFALTDHDSVKGIDEAMGAAEKWREKGTSITVIPGIELSAAYQKRDIHLLGLLIDYQNPQLLDILDQIAKERERRNQKMIENLQKDGIAITMEALRESESNSILTRAHFAKFLTEHHYTKTVQDAFFYYLSEDGPYYVPRKYMSPEEAIDLILTFGGVPILAHPLLYHLPMEELDSLVKRLKDHGLAGIEAIYSSNTGYDEQNMKKLAAKYQLLLSGGSDFHGANKPFLKLGTGRGNLKIPFSILEQLTAWKTLEEN